MGRPAGAREFLGGGKSSTDLVTRSVQVFRKVLDVKCCIVSGEGKSVFFL